MKSYDQSRDRSDPIETILYLPKFDLSLVICHLTYLTFSVNLPNQLFKSTYVINFFIESATLLACGTSFL